MSGGMGQYYTPPVRTPEQIMKTLKSIQDFAIFISGVLATGALVFVASWLYVAKAVEPVKPPAPVAAPDLSCKCGTSKTSRPFRVTCPTCHYDLTVVPPILPTGDFGKVAKTGTGDMPK